MHPRPFQQAGSARYLPTMRRPRPRRLRHSVRPPTGDRDGFRPRSGQAWYGRRIGRPQGSRSLWELREVLHPPRPDDRPAGWILPIYEFGCDLARCASDSPAWADQPQLKGVSGHVEIDGRIDVGPGVDQIAKPGWGPSQDEIVHKCDETVEGVEVVGATEIAVIPGRDPPPALNRLHMADDGIPEQPVLAGVEDG